MDPALARVAFVSRVQPPLTHRAATPQPQPAAGVVGPASITGFFPPGHFRKKADPWMVAQRDRLLDILENEEASTAPQPGLISFSQSEVLPEYRNQLWEYSRADGRFVLTDTSARPDTHLNLAFSALFSSGYPDQELFSILDFGVDFKADLMEFQLVLPSHLRSVAGGLGKAQLDLVRKAALGWYDVFEDVPRMPWRPQQVGTRAKRGSEKRRVIINASFPHHEMADDSGTVIHSLNHLSKLSNDVVLGCDGARMERMVGRLRTTCSSPPPSDGDVSVQELAVTAPRSARA